MKKNRYQLKHSILVILTLILCAAVYAQTGQTPPPAAPNPQGQQPVTPAPGSPPANPDQVIAEMGEYKLTEADLSIIISMLPGGARQNLNPERRKQIVHSWLQIVAFAQQAKELNLDKDALLPKQVEFYRKQLLAERYQRQLLADVKVTDEEVRQYYELNKEKLALPAMVRASRIVVPTREKAAEVEQALKQGTSFEAAAKTYSTDGVTKDKGGDIGWLKPGAAEKIFEATALSTEIGQVSSPIQTAIGWQIVKVIDKRPGQPKPFEEVQKVLEGQLLTQKRQQKMDTMAKELFDKYGLKMSEGQK